MRYTALNQTQIHLLKMFSFAKSEHDLENIKLALTSYFAKQAEDAMDKLWDDGVWNNEKNENVLRQHLRTPYND